MYRDGKGLYQESVTMLNNYIPSEGFTTNKLLNLYITLSKVYMEIHYNKGENLYPLKELIRKHVYPYKKQIDFKMTLLSKTVSKGFRVADFNYEALEKTLDRAIYFIVTSAEKGESLEYDRLQLYCERDLGREHKYCTVTPQKFGHTNFYTTTVDAKLIQDALKLSGHRLLA